MSNAEGKRRSIHLSPASAMQATAMGDNVRGSQGPAHRASYKGCGNEGPLRSYAQGTDHSVRNVFRLTAADEKVWRDEKTGKVTHRRADALDISFGQLDKRVVILMRGLDSSFRNELEKMKDNEASIAHRKNKKLTAMTCLEQRLKSFTMDQVTLRADLLQQTAIFCEGKDSLVQLQQRLGKKEARMQKQAEAMEAMVIGQESLEKTMESFVDGMEQ